MMSSSCKIILILCAIIIVVCSNECTKNEEIEISVQTNNDQIRDRVHAAYKSQVLNAPKILKSIEKFPVISQKYAGYRFLFIEMKQNEDLYTKELMLLAYQLHLLTATNAQSDDNVKYILDNLPQSVKNFPWDGTLVIKNSQFKENLASVRSEKLQASSSSHHVTSKPKSELEKWVLKPGYDGLGFRIYEIEFAAFLYAGNNSDLHDYERRKAIVGNEVSFGSYDVGDIWMFEPQRDSSSFRIINLDYDEYLYLFATGREYNSKTDDRPVFLWRKYGCDGSACEFSIEDVPDEYMLDVKFGSRAV